MHKTISKPGKIIIIVAALATLLALQISGVTAAWFSNKNEMDPRVNNGVVIQKYFDSGDGSKENPFVITRPVHYFHMAELYQRDSSFYQNEYYFQIGKQLKLDKGDNGYYVYNYDDTGSPISEEGNEYSTSLNMAYYCNELALLPIGSSEVPFNGKIDGKGLQVSNLHIKSVETIQENIDGVLVSKTFESSDIGIFGYIEGAIVGGTYKGGYVHDIKFENVVIDLEGLNFEKHPVTSSSYIEDGKNVTYVGYIAGHLPVLGYNQENGSVNVTGILENVYINECSVIGATESGYKGTPVNRYGIIGHITSLNGVDVPSLKTIIESVKDNAPSEVHHHGEGELPVDALGWGASLDMAATYDRLVTIYNLCTDDNYYFDETKQQAFYLYLGLSDTNLDGSNDDSHEKIYGGSYYYAVSDLTTNPTIYLSGAYGEITDIIKYTDGFYINRGSNYLDINTSLEASNALSKEDAMNFEFETIGTEQENNKYLYFDISEDKYYVNSDNDGNLVISDTPSTVWHSGSEAMHLDGNSALTTIINDEEYFLTYYQDEWKLIKVGTFYNIKYQGKYLTISDDEEISYSEDYPTNFEIDEYYYDENTEISSFKLYRFVDGVKKYLTIDSSKKLSLTADVNLAKLLYTDSENEVFIIDSNEVSVGKYDKRYYLVYSETDSWIFAYNDVYYLIADGGMYLANDNNDLIGTDFDGSTRWYIDSNKNIYTIIGEDKYYLTCDYSDSDNVSVWLTQSTSSLPDWHFEQSLNDDCYYTNISVLKQGSEHYLTYVDGEWMLVPTGTFYEIKDGNYGLVISDKSTQEEVIVEIEAIQNQMTRLSLDSNGHLYVYKAGARRYITISENYDAINRIYLTTNIDEACSWNLVDDLDRENHFINIFTVKGSEEFEYYLTYDASLGYWKAIRTGDTFSFYDKDNQSGVEKYLGYNKGSIIAVDDEEDAVHFIQEEGNKYYFFDENSNRKYLNVANDHLILSSTGCSWIYNEGLDGNFNTSKNGLYYYLVCEDGTWDVSIVGSYITIYDDTSDVFMKITDEDTITTSTVENEYTRILIEAGNVENERKYSVIIDENKYYLAVPDDGFEVYLTLDESKATSWILGEIEDNPNQYYAIYIYRDNYTYKVTFDANTSKWQITKFGDLYSLRDGDNYMKVNNDLTLSSTTGINASSFGFEEITSTSGKLSIAVGNKTYYLSRTNKNQLTFVENKDDASVWNTTTDFETFFTSVKYDDDILNYYLCYDDGWKLELVNDLFYFDLMDGETHQYLLGDALEDSITISNSSYTSFILSDNHYLYVVIDDVRYFLNKGNGIDLHFGTEPITTWNVSKSSPYTATTTYNYKVNGVSKYSINYVLTIVDNEWLLEVNQDYFTISNEFDEFVYTATVTSPYKTTEKWYKESAGKITNENNVQVDSYYLYVISRVNSQRMYLYNAIEDDSLTFLTYDEFMALPASSRTKFVLLEDTSHNWIGTYTIKNDLTYYIMCEDNGDDTYTWKLEYVGKSFDIKYVTEKDTDGTPLKTFYLDYFKGEIGILMGTSNKPSTMWFYDEENLYIFTTIKGTKYYVNYSEDLMYCYISTDEYTCWMLEEPNEEELYTGNIYTAILDEDINDYVYQYLIYDESLGWTLDYLYYYRKIHDTDGNYISYNPNIIPSYDEDTGEITTNIISVTDPKKATNFIYDSSGNLFVIDENDEYLYLTTYIDSFDVKYLIVSPERLVKYGDAYNIPAIQYIFYDSVSSDGIVPIGQYTLYDANDDLYVFSEDGIWFLNVASSSILIYDSYSGKYLGIEKNGSDFEIIGTDEPISNWILDYDQHLYTIFNGSYYYLNLDEDNLKLEVVDSYSHIYASFIFDDFETNENISILSDETDYTYKIKFIEDKWIVERSKSTSINYYDNVSKTTYYLNVSFDTVGNEYVPTCSVGTTSDDSTQWFFENKSRDTVDKINKSYINNSGNIAISDLTYFYVLDPNRVKWYLNVDLSNSTANYALVTLEKTKPLDYFGFVHAKWSQSAMSQSTTYSLIAPVVSDWSKARDAGNKNCVLRYMVQDGGEPVWCLSTVKCTQATRNDRNDLKVSIGISSNTAYELGQSFPFMYVDFIEFENDLHVDVIIHEMDEIDYENISPTFDKNLYYYEVNIPGDVELYKNTNDYPMIITQYDKQPPDHVLVRNYYNIVAPDNVSIDLIIIEKPDSMVVEQYREEFDGSILLEITIGVDDITIVRILNEQTIEHNIDITTYVPLITKLFDYSGDADISNEYSPSTLNTGYIISGNDTNASNLYSDVHVSKNTYVDTTGAINKSFNDSITEFNIDADSSMEVLTLNPSDGNYYRITDLNHNTSHPNVYSPWIETYPAMTVLQLGLNGYENPENNISLARDKFANILSNDPTSIYGLRFASTTSRISLDNVVTLKNISILGTNYDYYQMPNNSIDFTVFEQGTINIFAGTYYQGNNALFSLHHIIRDNDDINKIKDIYEIETIYKVIDDDTAPYIYKYKGYNLATTYQLDQLEVIFDMTWLTNPSLEQNAVYYYEIPVNTGEYALGSVENKEGAYLLYLDVANKGASEGGQIEDPDAPFTPQESTTPAPVTSTKPIINNVDYRSASQEIEIDDGSNHTLKFYIGYDVPDNATEDKFSLEVKYQEATDRDDYADISEWCDGVYQIYIKNLTGHNFDLDVLLIDPNPSEDNPFRYAFEILLWNGERYITIQNNEVAYTSGYRGPLRRWSDTYTVFGASISAKYH